MKLEIYAIRICSPNKSPVTRGYLREIYVDKMLQAFFKKMQHLQFPYAILSRKYGICIEHKNNTSYTDAEELPLTKLEQLLRIQSQFYQNCLFFYWNHRPLTHNKWVKLLHDTGFSVVEITKLKMYENIIT